MGNVAFTPKGDHIARTRIAQFTSKSSFTDFLFLQCNGICILSASMWHGLI